MTVRQKILKRLYPLFMWVQQKKAGQMIVQNKMGAVPPVSFYSLSVVLNNGSQLPFENFRGKKVLLVNTASNCGYTHQYAELQMLYRQANERVAIIAFPANDFKEQEKGSDEEIAAFCTRHYGVSFPVARKTEVVNGPGQHPVYQWLTQASRNGWNNKAPSWNFAKYLVNEEGVLTHYFEPAMSPAGTGLLRALHR